MRTRQRSRRGFTLIEVLVSIFIIALVSSMGWFAVSSYTKSEMFTRNRVAAVNLMQKAQENLRGAAQTFFDNLEDANCGFIPLNTCGLDSSITTGLPPDYSINLNITRESSSELKKALLTVNWSEFDAARSISSIVYLARPPDPLPGNVIGRVTGSNTSGAALRSVNITLTPNDGSRGITTTTAAEWGHTNQDGSTRMINYDYAGMGGQFNLKPGSYTLRAQRSNYANYIHPVPVIVLSQRETVVDFVMMYAPAPPPVCGNGRCESGESCRNCPNDCGICPPPPVCGNGRCESGESCRNCSRDCGICPGV